LRYREEAGLSKADHGVCYSVATEAQAAADRLDGGRAVMADDIQQHDDRDRTDPGREGEHGVELAGDIVRARADAAPPHH